MKKYKDKCPEEVMKIVTTEIIVRAIKLGKKKGRTVFISKTSGGKGRAVTEMDPSTAEGKEELEKYLSPVRRHYTFHGLGSPEEKNSINWRVLNLPFLRRTLLIFQVFVSFLLKGSPGESRNLRTIGSGHRVHTRSRDTGRMG